MARNILTIQTRGPYRNGQHSRGQVLLAATVVFAEHGYAAGSLRKIAEQAAMTEPGVLRLFGSKRPASRRTGTLATQARTRRRWRTQWAREPASNRRETRQQS